MSAQVYLKYLLQYWGYAIASVEGLDDAIQQFEQLYHLKAEGLEITDHSSVVLRG